MVRQYEATGVARVYYHLGCAARRAGLRGELGLEARNPDSATCLCCPEPLDNGWNGRGRVTTTAAGTLPPRWANPCPRKPAVMLCGNPQASWNFHRGLRTG